ncbi:MAG: lipo-like protein [Pseudomonadales bacterium]|nr:lipo-like protein [Pseudomonadales bacterium]
MNGILRWLGGWLARYLSRRHHIHGTAPGTSIEQLRRHIKPGDVLLVEGDTRISQAIKYLTQSTWSHAALYVGEYLQVGGNTSHHCFIEADTVDGVRSIGFEEYQGMHLRICRPLHLNDKDLQHLIHYAISRIGHHYDLRNVVDLARYLIPTPPVPQRFRRRMLALGSGDPSQAICSSLIAQSFQSIRYPILPLIEQKQGSDMNCPECIQEILHVRHHSLFVPRDFDVSPFFQVIKPSASQDFDFHGITWHQED